MRRLLLVGWDAADWKIIDPLIARGEMPHLAGVIAQGVRGNIATIHPPLSPMLWTSIATGKRAHKHGIHGFTEPTEDGLGIRRISNLSRKTKAFWNILNQNGKRCIVVGWWPSHPAEPLRGVMVSNHFPLSVSQHPETPMAPGTVWPEALAASLAELRVHGAEITGDMLRMFAKDFAALDQTNDKSLHDLAGIIAESMSIHAAATELIEHQEWDVAAIYYVGIDHFSHRFMRFHAGKTPRKQAPEARMFAGVVANAYRYHDVMLGRLLALAGDDCSVMLTSDHGFHSDRLLPDYIPAEAAGPAAEHRNFGVFCMRAPGVAGGNEIFGATILDIAPTVLHLAGLPSGADMDGRVLINAFENQTVFPQVPSWDEIPGDDGRHPAWRQYDSAAAAESLQQLVNLGYIAPLGEDVGQAVAQTVEENQYNLARAYMDAGFAREGARILKSLVANDSGQGRYYLHLFECWFTESDYDEATRVLDAFDRAFAAIQPEAAAELARRRAACPDEKLPADVQGRQDPTEIMHRRKLAEQASGFELQRVIARARLLMAQSQSPSKREAAHHLLEQLDSPRGRPEMAFFLAMGFATLKDYPVALDYIRRVRRADKDHWQVISLEARVHQAAGRDRECVECAVDSLALVYFQPILHYHMGLSLRRLGDEVRAEQSFAIALRQMPGLVGAHLELSKIMRKAKRLGEANMHLAQAKLLRDEAKRRREDRAAGILAPLGKVIDPGLLPIDRWEGAPPEDRSKVVTIVSGLPRSGTSMMMRLLDAAGIEPYTDGLRQPDADNPRGYFEHERATRLHQDASWLHEARGKAVKIVAHLLPRLPHNEQYRIVFMRRNLEEVLASQRAMLERSGHSATSLSDSELERVYTGQLVRIQDWIRRAPGVEVTTIGYAEALGDPAAVAGRLAEFLGQPFDQARAAGAVEPALRRQVRPD